MMSRMAERSSAGGPVHLIITMIKWIQTSRLSITNSISLAEQDGGAVECWGRNNEGQLGSGDRVTSFSPVTTPSLTPVDPAWPLSLTPVDPAWPPHGHRY